MVVVEYCLCQLDDVDILVDNILSIALHLAEHLFQHINNLLL